MKRFVLFITLFLIIAISWQVHLAFALSTPNKVEDPPEITEKESPEKETQKAIPINRKEKTKASSKPTKPNPKPVEKNPPEAEKENFTPIETKTESKPKEKVVLNPKKKTESKPLSASKITSTPRAKPSSEKEEASAFQQTMLSAVNQRRSQSCKCGGKSYSPVKPLKWDRQLETAARKHTLFMQKTGNFSHTGFQKSSVGKRAKMEGYKFSYVGENIASGQSSINEVVQDWMDSPGHCKLIMDGQFDDMGAYRSGNYWTLDFGRRSQ